MTRVSIITIVLVSVVFALVVAENPKDLDLAYDDVQNDEASVKDGKFKSTLKSKNKKGCKSTPDAPVNGFLECSKQDGCQAICPEHYRFPNGENKIIIVCHGKEWKIQGADYTSIPQCEPICLPECKNNGICIAPNRCDCPENFSGPQCQFENKPCLNLPSIVNNAQRKCTSKSCTVTCLNHFAFPDGSSVANLVCKHGNWEPTRSDWVAIPDCQPVCEPPCQNGGVCLPLNTCQCPKDFRGAQCQYNVDACSGAKLGFNGGYECEEPDDASYSCRLSCPPGGEFEFTPASSYVCLYSTGHFDPQPVPRCVFPGVEVVRLVSQSASVYQHTSSDQAWSVLQSGDGFHHSVLNTSSSSISSSSSTFLQFGFEGTAKEVQSGVNSDVVGIKTERLLKKPEPGTCFTWAGTHYKTFDGHVYSFESSCTYVLLKDTRDGLFTIAIQNEASNCDKKKDSRCTSRLLRVFVQGKEYALGVNRSSGQPEIRSAGGKVLTVPTQLPHLRVEAASAGRLVASLDAFGLVIQWDAAGLVQIQASEVLWNRTTGLCGSMNGEREDDLGGKSIAHAVAGWRLDDVGEKCEEHPSHEVGCAADSNLEREAREFCVNLLSDARYQRCTHLVDLSGFEAACRWDYCTCNETKRKNCACDTMGVYVQQCAHKGIVPLAGWRNSSICPMACSEGKVYSSCGPRSQSSCGSAEASSTSDQTVGAVTADCEEGCFCPSGRFLHEGRCVAPEECPCRLRGKSFPPGSSVPKDCNSCVCAPGGRWLCTENNCGARCSAVGDPHYTTFDGKRFDFMGQCSYYLVSADNYSVEAENAACAGAISEAMGFTRTYKDGEPSCTKTVTVRLNNVAIKLKQNRQILVNGEDVTKLPTLAGGAKLRFLSSIFVSIELPNGLEVLWDGVSRVYVNAPARFRGKTKGLCGTFTSNQKDDFLTPDGDVEQSVVAFANKWKTSEQCADVKKDSDHPCDLNPQKRAAAEKYCSAMKKKLFTPCHWHVDPEPFYRDCTYDMCACEAELEACLCPVLAAYAKDCAQLGVVVPWRQEVQECRVHCPGDQEYQMCGDSCARSCADIAFQEGNCKPECVEGCNCPRGQTLDANGDCVPIGQCPCVRAGLEFIAGYREVRPGSKGQELCTCAGGIWNCRLASKDEIREYPEAAQLKNLCSASRHLEVTTCEPAEPRTCRNMHQPLAHSPAICRPGCVCKSGYVLDLPSGQCVREQDCPCYHGGQSYKEGSIMQEECNTCTCSAGRWNCTDIVCPGVCSVWGDSHYKTFDDREFDFQGACEYVLAKGNLGDTESFEVTIRNVACGTTGVTCSKSISLSVGGNNYARQESITLTRGKILTADTFKGLERITSRRAGLFVFLDVPDLDLVLQWDEGTRVYLRLGAKWKGRTRGLCGDFDDDAGNDFKTPSGGPPESSVGLFADSWKLSEHCAEAAEQQLQLRDACGKHPERKLWASQRCRVLKSALFQPCHSEVPVDGYIERCVYDACACDDGGDCECLCTALAAYAHQCAARGVPIQWRSQKLCPMQCDESCSRYSSCVSTCPLESCDNLLTRSDALHLCDADVCVEGCLPKPCPEGFVYSNGSHADCVPRTECKSPCTIIDGREFYEGDWVRGDNCQSCFCSRGKVVCKGAPCPDFRLPTVVELKEETKKCVSGWSKWFNRDVLKEPGLRNDVEELPTLIEMLSEEGAPVCEREKMVDIECRTVDTKIHHKEVGLDIECSLDKGSVCLSTADSKQNCPDMEIRVLCACESPSTTAVPTIVNECVIGEPYRSVIENCQEFLQCGPGLSGNVWTSKRCDKGTMFNQRLQICDWPPNVVVVRPECGNATTTQIINNTIEYEKVDKKHTCAEGEHWSDCAIRCSKACEYYKHVLTLSGSCNSSVDCVAGCVPNTISDADCSSNDIGRYWRDRFSCVDRSDCVCKTENGRPVSPGTIVKESDCRSCQCINNYYTCDESACESNSIDIKNTFETLTTTTTTTTNHSVTKSRKKSKYQLTVVPNTLSPPRDCEAERYVPLSSTLAASSYRSDLSEAALESSNAVIWRPVNDDTEEWLELRMDRPRPVYGIVVGADAATDEFVTSYNVLFSEDGQVYSYVSDEKTGEPRLLRGPADSATPVRQIFHPPIEAKVVRLSPITWHKGIAVQAQLVGCEQAQETTTATPLLVTPMLTETPVKPVCDDSMGYDEGRMADQQVSVSSSSLNTIIPNLRLSSMEIWRPLLDNPDQYVQFDFLEERKLTGVETKGGNGIWTTAYKVFYSSDGKNWNPVIDEDSGAIKEFLGNVDDYSSKLNYFQRPVAAKLLRIFPTKWHRHIGLKVEVHGCYLPYPIVAPPPAIPPPPPAPPSSCNVCNGVVVDNQHVCKCDGSLWWDGRFCVTKQECPCIVGHVSYPVGASYETSDCQHCLCALGGGSICQPKLCSSCPKPDERPVLTELCACLCKPCPVGKRLCPTSNDCVDEARWCDGVQDCPDDENGCRAITHANVLKQTTIKIECQTSCPPGFVMELENARESQDMTNLYANYGYTVEKTETLKSSYTKQVYKIKVPAPARKFESRFGEESDEYEQQCPKFICKPIVDNRPPKYEAKQCPKVECPAGFQPKFDQSKSYRKNSVCDNTCVPIPPKERVCSLVGRTFSTFDQLQYKYSVCKHILARDRDQNRWYIVVEKVCKPGEDNQLICTRNLIVSYGEHTIQLLADMSAKIDNVRAYSPSEVKRLADRNPEMKLSRIGDSLRFESRRYPFWALLEADGSVKVGVSEELAGHVDGMCGFLDGLAANDQQTPGGELASDSQSFGDSWRVPDTSAECQLQECPRERQAEAWKICTRVRDASFEPCANLLDRERFVSSCLESSCACLGQSNQTSIRDCRCRALSSFVAECLAAANNSIDLSAWRSVHDCPAVCEAPFVHKDCFGYKCEMSCEKLNEPEPCPPTEGLCVTGCFCPDGLVRNGDACVSPAECRDCACDGLANSKYVTFDRASLNFEGNCTYLLSRDVLPAEATDKKRAYEVFVSNGVCTEKTCIKAITVLHESHVVQIKRGNSSEQLISIVDEQQIDKLPYKTSWLNLEKTPNQDVKLLIPAIQLELVSFKRDFAFMLRLPSHTFGGAMEGLCGNCNGKQADDFKKSDGQITNNTQEFGDSWLLEDAPSWMQLDNGVGQCSSKPTEKKICAEQPSMLGRCERLLADAEFALCHYIVDPMPYYLACKDSLCAGADGCADFEAYARICGFEGICLEWREPGLCPYQCPSHLEYRACGPSCTESCASLSNPSDNDLESKRCSSGPRVEGCFCPNDEVWHNESCVPRRSCFVCDSEGHVDGDIWQPDKCTECTCHGRNVHCQQTSCPAIETVCDENSVPVLVPGTEQLCCPKYLCVPVTTTAPSCAEALQPECGYAQVLKTTLDANGCQKFICQCVPEEECPIYDIDVRISQGSLEPGFVEITNTSGCCPRTMTICKPELCPKTHDCPQHYQPVVKDNPNSCCGQIECVLPKDACLYYWDSNNNDFAFQDDIVVKKIGETWSDGKCKNCICELQDGLPVAKCTAKECMKMHQHPDVNEYILEEVPINGECCPIFERIACRQQELIFQVGEKWQPDLFDACVTTSCVKSGQLISKLTLVQNCTETCEPGYEYRPPEYRSETCCGECVPVACAVDGELKPLGHTWHSTDYCATSSCVLNNGSLQVQVSKAVCESVDPLEALEYKLEERKVPGECCPIVERTACIGDDALYHQPGESWKSRLDACVLESCVKTLEGKVVKQKETKTCSTDCPRGWEYQLPQLGNCCGECKQIYCISENYLYEPGQVWYSDDNCTTYSCVQMDDQLVVTTSLQTCPELNCAPEDAYVDGCCKKCTPFVENKTEKQPCAVEVLDFVNTIGIIVEKKGIHGICRNLNHIDGLTECHGHCNSSTHFDTTTWNQVIDCKCCQPVDYRKIIVELTCEDGKQFEKQLTVPITCSCEKCSSEEESPVLFKPLHNVKKFLKKIHHKP